MSNERLRDAMIAAHIDLDTISRETGVDPKTVQRWLKGRVPHARHRWKMAEMLKEHEDFLWPQDDHATNANSSNEIAATYAHRSDVSPNAWWQLFLQAKHHIDLLGYAMHFLPEQHARLTDLLQEKAAHGCKIRIALADPTSTVVKMRDEEEGLGGALSGLIQVTIYHFRDLRNCPGIELRYHTTPMYNSVFRFDNAMFVTPHLYGQHGSKAPLLYLRCMGINGVFMNFLKHFEDVWATAKPME